MSGKAVLEEGKSRKFAPKRNYIPYTALTLDEEYCVCTYGNMACSLFGFPEAAMLGKHVGKLLPALAAGLEKGAGRDASPLCMKNVRMEALHADGSTFSVMVGLRQDHLHGSCRHLVLVRNLEARPQP